MTTTYTTIKLREISGSGDPAVIDRLYAFEARADNDANGDGKSDFFEAKKAETTKISSENFISANGRPIPQSRYFVDDAGTVWRGEYARTRGEDGNPPASYLTGFENAGEFIAPSDIGRVFRNKEGNAEFSDFTTAVAGICGKILDDIAREKAGHEKSLTEAEKTRLGEILKDPGSAGVKELFSLTATPEFVTANVTSIERADLLYTYVQEALRLAATNDPAYAIPKGITTCALGAYFTPNSAASAPPAPAAPAAPPKADDGRGTTNETPSGHPDIKTSGHQDSMTSAQSPNALSPGVAWDRSVTLDDFKTDGIAIITRDITAIAGMSPSAVPVNSDGARLASVRVKSGRVMDQTGDKHFLRPDRTYADSAEDLYQLHRDLWTRARRADPKRYYLGFDPAPPLGAVEQKSDSGWVTFADARRDINTAAGLDGLKKIAEELKNAKPEDVTSLKLTGSASATGETVVDAKKKPVVITAANLATIVNIETGELKPGYSWVEKPPTGNNVQAARKSAEAVIAYLEKDGVETKTVEAVKESVVLAGGSPAPRVRLEFTLKAPAATPVTTTMFTGVPAEAGAALGTLTGVRLKDYFQRAEAIAGNTALSETERVKKIIVLAVEVDEFIMERFTEPVAGDVARQLAALLKTHAASAPGSLILAKVLPAAYPGPAPEAVGTRDVGLSGSHDVNTTGPQDSPTSAPPDLRTSAQSSDADRITLTAKTTFTVGKTAPQVAVKGDATKVKQITVAWKAYRGTDIAFTRAGDGTLTLTGMIAFSAGFRDKLLAESTFDDNGKGDLLGVGDYDLIVTFKDGSTERLQVHATGV